MTTRLLRPATVLRPSGFPRGSGSSPLSTRRRDFAQSREGLLRNVGEVGCFVVLQVVEVFILSDGGAADRIAVFDELNSA